MAEGTENPIELCFFCTSVGKGMCRTCSRYYCESHTSPMDVSLCMECVNFVNTSTTSVPLVDEDGVTKQNARKILLTGESWMRSRELISNMTDIELEAKIRSYQDAVHEAELVLDYRRIMLGQAQHEGAERYNKKIRARSERVKLLGAVDKVHKVAGSTIKEKGENISKALGALGKLGLTKEQIASILLNVSKNKPK